MKKNSSKLAPLIEDYLEFRAAMGPRTMPEACGFLIGFV